MTKIGQVEDNYHNPSLIYLPDPPVNHKLNSAVASAINNAPQETFARILTQADTSKAPEEQKNILKLAFAEGYLAANGSEGGKKDGKGMKYLKVILNLDIITVG